MTSVAATRSRFFAWTGFALALVIFAGFARTFYLRTWFEVPSLPTLLYVHGALFSAWVILYVSQVSFIASGQFARHRLLGGVGAVLVTALVVVGLMATAVSAATPKPHVGGLSSPQFSLIPLVEVVGFAALVVAALLRRRHPAEHKRLMMLAMIMAIAPATARLIGLAGLGNHYLALQTLTAAAFIAAMAVNDWRQLHTVHRITAIGGILLIASWPLRMWVAGSAFWAPAGRWIASLGGSGY